MQNLAFHLKHILDSNVHFLLFYTRYCSDVYGALIAAKMQVIYTHTTGLHCILYRHVED